MTPGYLLELADLADPDQLWRLPALDQMALPAEKRKQLDAGVALRRHASHIDRLRGLLSLQRSLVITPLSPNSTATMTIVPPHRHRKMLEKRGQQVDATQAPAPAQRALALPDELHVFLNAAAGEGLVLDGIDAADLYVMLFPKRFAEAISQQAQSEAAAQEYAGARCMCVVTGCRPGPGCPHYTDHCKAHIAHVAAASQQKVGV